MLYWQARRNSHTNEWEFFQSDDITKYKNFLESHPKFTLVLTWLAGFNLGMLSSAQEITCFEQVLRRNPRKKVIIHGVWLDQKYQFHNYDMKKIKKKLMFWRIGCELNEILENDKELASFVCEFWFDPRKWEEINFDKYKYIDWNSHKDRLEIVIYEYIKHALLSGMPLIVYLQNCKKMFDQVDPSHVFAMHLKLNLNDNEALFTLNQESGGRCKPFVADTFETAFRLHSPSNISPSFDFRSVKFKIPHRHTNRICSLDEMQFEFDENLLEIQKHVKYYCQCGLKFVTKAHRCVLLSHADRLFLMQHGV